MAVQTAGVPPQDVTTKIVHRQTSKLLVMNREHNGTMALKEKSGATGADGEFWTVVPLETGANGVPTKVRLDCKLKQDGNVPYDLIPSNKYPGCFRLFYQSKLFIGHEGGPTGVSTTFGDLSAPELDKDIWYFEYTPVVVLTIDVYISEILVKIGALIDSFLKSSGKKPLRNLAHALDLAVDNFAALAKAAGRIEAAKLAALQALSDALYNAITNDPSAKELGEALGKFLRGMAEVVVQFLGAVGGVVGQLVVKIADFVEKFLSGIATAAESGALAFVNFLSEINGMILGIRSWLTGTLAAALLRVGINVAVLAEAFGGLVTAFSSIKLDGNMSLGSLTVETAVASLAGALSNVFTCFGGLLKDVTVYVESSLSKLPEAEGPLHFLSADPSVSADFKFELVAEPFGLVVAKVGELLLQALHNAGYKVIRDAAIALDAAVDALITVLKGFGVVSASVLTVFGELSDALYKAATSVNCEGLGKALENLLKMVGDVFEVILRVSGVVVVGLGVALKNLLYQLASVVGQLVQGLLYVIFGVDGGVFLGPVLDSVEVLVNTIIQTVTGSLAALLVPLGLNVTPFADALSRLAAAIKSFNINDQGPIFTDMFSTLSVIIIGVFTVLTPKEYDFQLLARPFGLVLSKHGELLQKVLGETGKDPIKKAADAFQFAVNALIELLTSVSFVGDGSLNAFRGISDAVYATSTSDNLAGLGQAVKNFLNAFGDLLQIVLGAAAGVNVARALVLKDVCYQLGCIMQKVWDNQPAAGLNLSIGTLTTLLTPLGLVPIMQPFADACSKLIAALSTSYNTTDLQLIVLNVFSGFSVVVIKVIGNVGTAPVTVATGGSSPALPVPPVTKPTGPVTIKVDIKPVAVPFANVLKNVGELLFNILNNGKRIAIRKTAIALDKAIDDLIELLRKLALVSAANLDAIAKLSDELVATTTSMNGVGRAISTVLKKLSEVTTELFGAAYANVSVAMKNFVDQVASLVNDFLDRVLPTLMGSRFHVSHLLPPILFPFATRVAILNNSSASTSLTEALRPFGVNAKPVSNTLQSLVTAFACANIHSIVPLFRNLFTALAGIHVDVINGISNRGGVETTVIGMGDQTGAVSGSIGMGDQTGAVSGSIGMGAQTGAVSGSLGMGAQIGAVTGSIGMGPQIGAVNKR